jgi:hypothetical protein
MEKVKEEILEQLKKQRQELKDWLYGTIYKQYDLEETAEAVQEDVDGFFPDEYFEKLLTKMQEEVYQRGLNDAEKENKRDKSLDQFKNR